MGAAHDCAPAAVGATKYRGQTLCDANYSGNHARVRAGPDVKQDTYPAGIGPDQSVGRKSSPIRRRAVRDTLILVMAKKAKPKLLSGGNPQIAKGDGDAPVQAYIKAMPGWKRDLGRRLDALIVRTVPDVHKAVKWNSPFYGIEDDGWFLNFHCFTKYVKVAFFRGTSLKPVPPGESKHKEVRYFDIHEDDTLDEKQFAAWVKQASKLPGERL